MTTLMYPPPPWVHSCFHHDNVHHLNLDVSYPIPPPPQVHSRFHHHNVHHLNVSNPISTITTMSNHHQNDDNSHDSLRQDGITMTTTLHTHFHHYHHHHHTDASTGDHHHFHHYIDVSIHIFHCHHLFFTTTAF